ADAGDMQVGANIGVAPCLESGDAPSNFGLGAKFRYGLSEKIRLEADMEYWFKDKGWSVFDITANAHYLFAVTDKINVYPLAGIGFAHLGGASFYIPTAFDEDGEPTAYIKTTNSADKFVFNIGGGAEYAINDRISVGFELKYQYINKFSRFPIQIGFTYKL
ncbi:MAG: porin family protein, partial [Muribaculum sp.]|nr:porin family protein [Muribaculum sp.]